MRRIRELRKKSKILVAITALCIVILWLGTPYIAKSELSIAQNKAEAFTEQVLPIDKSQYNITLDGYNVIHPSSDISPPDNKDYILNDFKQEYCRYSFVSDQSELIVIYKVENGFLTTCSVTVVKGKVLTDPLYSNVNDIIIGFLERYQAFTGFDSSDMRYMVSNANVMDNQTLLLGDLKLKIDNKDSFSLGQSTSLMWYRVINGCEYLQLSLGFTNGAFVGYKDVRELYPIGDTTINISKEQAIYLASKYVRENYTYEMPDKVWINDFSFIENQTLAVLSPIVRNTTQYPTWIITFTLDHTYPGSVVGLIVIVSARSGEILVCSNQAVGGRIPPSDNGANVVVLTTPPTLLLSPAPSSMANEASSGIISTVLVAMAIITLTLAIVAVLFRKKRK
jgi:hypothetical protein